MSHAEKLAEAKATLEEVLSHLLDYSKAVKDSGGTCPRSDRLAIRVNNTLNRISSQPRRYRA